MEMDNEVKRECPVCRIDLAKAINLACFNPSCPGKKDCCGGGKKWGCPDTVPFKPLDHEQTK